MTTTTIPEGKRRIAADYHRRTYADLMAQLPTEGGRTGRAAHLELMAETADGLATLTHGLAVEDDPEGDTLAWLDTGSLLRQLAACELGAVVVAVGTGGWEQARYTALAAAVTRDEHTAALTDVLAVLHANRDDGKPRYRTFAVEQFRRTAAACNSAYPATWPAVPPARM
jgi:hypothetical protein